MSLFGFSTGALALGDFRRALELLQGVDADAVELSALREKELPDFRLPMSSTSGSSSRSRSTRQAALPR